MKMPNPSLANKKESKVTSNFYRGISKTDLSLKAVKIWLFLLCSFLASFILAEKDSFNTIQIYLTFINTLTVLKSCIFFQSSESWIYFSKTVINKEYSL